MTAMTSAWAAASAAACTAAASAAALAAAAVCCFFDLCDAATGAGTASPTSLEVSCGLGIRSLFRYIEGPLVFLRSQSCHHKRA